MRLHQFIHWLLCNFTCKLHRKRYKNTVQANRHGVTKTVGMRTDLMEKNAHQCVLHIYFIKAMKTAVKETKTIFVTQKLH